MAVQKHESKRNKAVEQVVENTEVKPTDTQVVAAMTNDPLLSEHQVEFGGKVYTLVDLSYDDYMKFLVLLQPFLESVVMKLADRSSPINVGDIVRHCGESLPHLVYLSLKQVDEDIDILKIKEIAKTPFKLVPVVVKQIEKNQMIKEFSDFFVQMLPMVKSIG